MNKRIPIGVEDYKDLKTGSYYYIDKTSLIEELLEEGGKVNLFTRPRRFGKTLALSMLRTFFEDERDWEGNRIDNSEYFMDAAIFSAGEQYRKHLGQYPVISLSLKSAKQPDFAMAYECLQNDIAREFERHDYILRSEVLLESNKEKYCALRDRKAGRQEYNTALKFLSECLQKYHQKKVIILIDEYDVPLENAYFRGFYSQMIDFIRSLFESALKTNDALEFAVITGCLRISKESIFTGLNNLKIISVLNNDYAEFFGFTQKETEKLLADFGIPERTEEVKQWYDGYLFGQTEVYNPWSMINYVDAITSGTTNFPKPFWSNTSSNSIIRELVEEADMETRREIEVLLDNGTIEKRIHEDITYEDIHESQDNLWNFLFFTGYLKKCGERFENRNIYLKMAIPNEEVAYIYENNILTWFDKKIRGLDMAPFRQAMETGDCKQMEQFISAQLMDTISIYDYAENYYHGFLAGLLKCLGNYSVSSNRESGTGRSDLLLRENVFRGRGIILELKVAKDFKQMEEKCEEALAQIEDRQYEQELRSDGYETILKYGVCFFKKGCMIRN